MYDFGIDELLHPHILAGCYYSHMCPKVHGGRGKDHNTMCKYSSWFNMDVITYPCSTRAAGLASHCWKEVTGSLLINPA